MSLFKTELDTAKEMYVEQRNELSRLVLQERWLSRMVAKERNRTDMDQLGGLQKRISVMKEFIGFLEEQIGIEVPKIEVEPTPTSA